MAYLKKGNDVQYRWVSLNNEKVPAFLNFESGSVPFKADCVLEIRKADGTTVIECEGSLNSVSANRKNNSILLPKSLPTGRLWVRELNRSGIAYKIPNILEIRDENQVFEVPAGADKVEVFGDKYFSAAYDLINL